MNLLHIKYAVEVAETGSINRAAEKLLIGQPNLSRAIKELESSLDTKIFDRSAKGMTLTAEGKTFLFYAKRILKQVDAVEETFRHGVPVRRRFSASVPCTGYITEAFARFAACPGAHDDAEICYREANASRTIAALLQEDCKLGILRYAASEDAYYKTLFEEKGLSYELITEFRHVLVMHRDCPLAAERTVPRQLPPGYTEVADADASLPPEREDGSLDGERRLFVSEGFCRLSVIAHDPRTVMWDSPMPQPTLARYGLAARPCTGAPVYKDVLLRRKDHPLSRLDNLFIEQLVSVKRECFKEDPLAPEAMP